MLLLALIGAISLEVVESRSVPDETVHALVALVKGAAEEAPRPGELHLEIRLIGGATRILMVLQGYQSGRPIGSQEIKESAGSSEWQARIHAAIAELFPLLAPPAPDRPTLIAPPVEPERPTRWLELGLIGGGALAAGAAIAFELSAQGQSSDLRKRAVIDDEFHHLESGLARDRIAGMICLGGSAGLIAAGLALVFSR